MNKSKAIKIINRQKTTIDNYGKNLLWISQTLSYFELFFGKNSEEYIMLHSFNLPGSDSQFPRENVLGNLNELLDNAILMVKDKGIIEHPKLNFLQRFNNWQMATVLITVGGIIFGIGVWVGATNEKAVTFEKAYNISQHDTTN